MKIIILESLWYETTVKPVLSSHSKRRSKLVFKTNYRFMHVKSIAECSIKIFVLSICEWLFKTGLTVHVCYLIWHTHDAPAIRRMWKGIKRCPCPSVGPCVLPFVHHLGRYCVSATPPTIFSQSFWNFTGVFVKDWRCAWHLDITLRLIFVTFFTVWT